MSWGVKYVPLNTVCEIYDGTHSTPKYMNQGIRFVSVENIGNLYASEKYISEEDYCKFKITPQINDIFMTRIGSIGVCTVVDREEPLAYYVSLALLRPNVEILNSYFLKYAIESFEGQKELYKRTLVNAVPIKVNKDDIGKILVPVPPLDVQQEIVYILDKFTKLDAGLRTELKARKKQYEYYKMKLLSFGEDVPVKELRKTCNMKAGKAISASNISESKNEVQKYACFGGNGVRGYVEFQSHKGEYPLIGRQGALCGNVNYATGDFYATEHAVVVTSLGEYTQRFLYYLLMAMNLNQYKSQGAQPGLAVGNIEKLLAPVPTIEEQQRIVTVLDTFEVICNDYSRGLPAEIEARHKQYEHYRDKLLTFKRKVV